MVIVYDTYLQDRLPAQRLEEKLYNTTVHSFTVRFNLQDFISHTAVSYFISCPYKCC